MRLIKQNLNDVLRAILCVALDILDRHRHRSSTPTPYAPGQRLTCLIHSARFAIRAAAKPHFGHARPTPLREVKRPPPSLPAACSSAALSSASSSAAAPASAAASFCDLFICRRIDAQPE